MGGGFGKTTMAQYVRHMFNSRIQLNLEQRVRILAAHIQDGVILYLISFV